MKKSILLITIIAVTLLSGVSCKMLFEPEVVPTPTPIPTPSITVMLSSEKKQIENHENIVFTAKTKEDVKSNLTYEWYIDNIKQDCTTNSFSFGMISETREDHTVKVVITSEGKQFSAQENFVLLPPIYGFWQQPYSTITIEYPDTYIIKNMSGYERKYMFEITDNRTIILKQGSITKSLNYCLVDDTLTTYPADSDYIPFSKYSRKNISNNIVQLISLPQIEVNIPDAALKAAMLKSLNKTTGVLFESDLQKIISINSYKENITDLTGLEYCTNIVYLRISDSRYISDFNPLNKLKNLVVLQLPITGLKNLDPISELSHLRHLDIRYNQVKDLRPIKSHKLLKLEIFLNGMPLDSSVLGISNRSIINNFIASGSDIHNWQGAADDSSHLY